MLIYYMYKYLFFTITIIFFLIVGFILIDRKRDNLTYCKCNRKNNNKLLQSLLDQNNILKNNYDWDIYIPCSYTNFEQEFKNLNITSKKQIIFGVPGCDKLVAKDKLWYYFVSYLGRKIVLNFLPQTYLLYNKNDIKLLKKNYNNSEIYILKKNLQQKKGIKITTSFNTIKNGFKDNYVVAQNYIQDLFLIKNRKINLRLYLLITIKNKNINWYLN